MTAFLLDTHIWVWYLLGLARLPSGLRQLLDAAPAACWLSPISIWEVGMLAARGRLQLDRPFPAWVAQAQQQCPLQEARLTHAVALRSQTLTLPHRDPADHFLAATALVYDLTLLTVDTRLLQASWLPTRSA